DVYPLFDIEPVRAQSCYVYDKEETEYLDLYGGHAVISIGHSHPHYVSMISGQLEKIGFYSNSVQNRLQKELATKLGKLSGYDDFDVFLCNSGAEANENALKLASFHTGRKRVISFSKSFHGRTSAAVSITDNPTIIAPINESTQTTIIPLNDVSAFEAEIAKGDVCAVIIEGIQGIGGIRTPEESFMQLLRQRCTDTGAILILDEIQSGYGRSGKFFAHQYTDVVPDLITVAKGMGSGFPIGGVLISPLFEAKYGMLGTTFGGNHMACAAAIAVLDVIKDEKLIENAAQLGEYLITELKKLPQIKEVRGKGLMIGLEFDTPVKDLRNQLLFEDHIFTGVSGTHIIRLLPPLCLNKNEADIYIDALKKNI
ncbi:MAG: aminotransferase class III-fold pyridoxal phosphate-dependent enzyme, partial [Bacteroidales bacterium]|nr:aminotransferase class III-fold pyridoxal phosphate-dependent enzyme [Bacteroidales bacterium]